MILSSELYKLQCDNFEKIIAKIKNDLLNCKQNTVRYSDLQKSLKRNSDRYYRMNPEACGWHFIEPTKKDKNEQDYIPPCVTKFSEPPILFDTLPTRVPIKINDKRFINHWNIENRNSNDEEKTAAYLFGCDIMGRYKSHDLFSYNFKKYEVKRQTQNMITTGIESQLIVNRNVDEMKYHLRRAKDICKDLQNQLLNIDVLNKVNLALRYINLALEYKSVTIEFRESYDGIIKIMTHLNSILTLNDHYFNNFDSIIDSVQVIPSQCFASIDGIIVFNDIKKTLSIYKSQDYDMCMRFTTADSQGAKFKLLNQDENHHDVEPSYEELWSKHKLIPLKSNCIELEQL